jgi:hypothetical protein
MLFTKKYIIFAAKLEEIRKNSIFAPSKERNA